MRAADELKRMMQPVLVDVAAAATAAKAAFGHLGSPLLLPLLAMLALMIGLVGACFVAIALLKEVLHKGTKVVIRRENLWLYTPNLQSYNRE